ncbi:MAG: catalase family protein [Janthinobacterium lividum]
MPDYALYSPDVETIEPDEQETHNKIIQVMTEGQNITREKYGKAVRISHAKSHGLLKGELTISPGLPSELAQGLFAEPGTHPVLIRLASAPGEFTDDSKLSTVRGMSIKVFNVQGAKLPPFEGIANQDFVLDTGKEFITGGAKAFLQAFKPNAEIAPKLSDNVKGAVSEVARVTNKGLNAVGLNSQKLDFYGHEKNHPMAESYYSQIALRYGKYIARLGVVPSAAVLQSLGAFDPETPDALREATIAYFRTHGAEFDVQIQLNTGLEGMPIEDAQAKWSEEESPYRTVARITIPAQNAYSAAREDFVDGDLSFSPAHTLVDHQPLGSVARARLAAYTALATLRRNENSRPQLEPANLDQVPA